MKFRALCFKSTYATFFNLFRKKKTFSVKHFLMYLKIVLLFKTYCCRTIFVEEYSVYNSFTGTFKRIPLNLWSIKINHLQCILIMLVYFKHNGIDNTDMHFCDILKHSFFRMWSAKHLSFKYRIIQKIPLHNGCIVKVFCRAF